MRIFVATLVVLVGLVAFDQSALAVARHERVEVKEWKEKGAVVGVKIKMTLITENGYTRARVSLQPAGGVKVGGIDHRAAASDASKGNGLHFFEDVEFKPNEPRVEKTFQVRFQDAPNLKPGTQIEIVSAFNNPQGNAAYWHVYGMSGPTHSNADKFTIPGSPAALRAPARHIRRAGPSSPRAQRPAARPAHTAPARARARSRAR